ncbi:MAG: hypothetical protein ABI365_00430, partial [Lysobacteraceae bacterium]
CLLDIIGLNDGASREAEVIATNSEGVETRFFVNVLLLTPKEVEYFRHGGILQYVLRDLAAKSKAA